MALAEKHSGDKSWGYRSVSSVDCDAVRAHADDDHEERAEAYSDAGSVQFPEDVEWVDPEAFEWFRPLGETAQVHPFQFCNTLAKLAEEKGAKILIGTAKSINYTPDHQEVESVTFQPYHSEEVQRLPVTDVVVCAGPWTKTILPSAPISSEKSHSIVVDPKRDTSGTILFFDQGNIDASDSTNQLEIYPRPDETVYIAGPTSYGLEIPETTDDVHVDEGACEKILETVGIVSRDLQKSEILVKQACFRPLVRVEGRDAQLGPLLGKTGIKGLLLAAGHNEWGIQNAPISGKVLSELVFDGRAKSADISALDPTPYLTLGTL